MDQQQLLQDMEAQMADILQVVQSFDSYNGPEAFFCPSPSPTSPYMDTVGFQGYPMFVLFSTDWTRMTCSNGYQIPTCMDASMTSPTTTPQILTTDTMEMPIPSSPTPSLYGSLAVVLP